MMEQNDPNFISGFAWWRAEDVPTLYVTATYGSVQHDTEAQLFYARSDMNGFDADHVVSFAITADGAEHTYAVPMAGAFGYDGVMVQLRLDPVVAGMPGAWVNVSSITAVKPGGGARTGSE